MRARTILVSLVMVAVAGVGICLAANPMLGTWKLNEAKSKPGPNGGKNLTVVYEMAGDSVKVIVDGVDKDGKPTHNEWTGKFDGKDYPVTGDPASDTRAYRKVDSHTLAMTIKKGGKATSTGRIVLAKDGKSRTVSTTSTDSKGKKVHVVSVYDKQ